MKGKRFSVVIAMAVCFWAFGAFTPRSATAGDGLVLEILGVHIDQDRRPQVTFKVIDATGNPLALSDLDASGTGTVRFTIAWLKRDPATDLLQWLNYVVNNVTGRTYLLDGVETQPVLPSATQAGMDPVGTYTPGGQPGVFVYSFFTTLPEGYVQSATHRVGAQVTRAVRRWVDNDTFDLVPAGGPVVEKKELAVTASCNQCHDPLAIHGGTRREVDYCVTCHTAQTTDPETGRLVDFKVLVHKIHRGAELPSVEEGTPFRIVGFGQSVHDYSLVEFPQDIRNCGKCHGEAFPQALWPSAAACTACHEHANPNTGENHRVGAFSDAECSLCHEPAGREFGISLTGAHTLPHLASEVSDINVEIVAVRDAVDGDEFVDPGHAARVIFNVKDEAGNPVAPSALAFFRFTLAGPTTDYNIQDYDGDGTKHPLSEKFLQVDARTLSTPVGDGNYTVTFALPLPRDASGTYAVGVEGYKCTTIRKLDQERGGLNCTTGNTLFNEVRHAPVNVVKYVPVTDPVPVPRRQVVANDNCAACHGAFSTNFGIHGGIRNNPQEYCPLCHNAAHDSLQRQPAPPAGQTATTFPVHFKVVIHKVHTGSNLTNPYLIFSPSGASTNVQDFHFPGDTANCQKCHLEGTNHLRPNLGPATITHEIDSGKVVLATFYTPPIKAACTACHDGDSRALAVPVATHTDLFTVAPNTPNAVEGCPECHGEGELLAVSYVHAFGRQ